MTFFAQLIATLNAVMGVLFKPFNGMISALPAWLSLSILSILLGALLLFLFKYTSPQKAYGKVKDDIKARLLGMKLFKDNIPVVLKYQLQVFAMAPLLLLYSIPPILVMALPFGLILGQMGAWYQAAPLEPGQPVEIIMQLKEQPASSFPEVSLQNSDSWEVVSGPVRAKANHQVFWKIKASQPGEQTLSFNVNGETIEKSLTVGEGLKRIGMKRPGMHVGDLILYPIEKPFSTESTIQSIEIKYPDRQGTLSGSGNWVITLLLVSMLGALAVKPFVNVKI